MYGDGNLILDVSNLRLHFHLITPAKDINFTHLPKESALTYIDFSLYIFCYRFDIFSL